MRPFQATMRRFGRKLDIEALRRELPLAVYFFDCLRRDGDVLVDRPTSERFAALTDLVPEPLVIPHLVTSDPAETQAFFDAALARGHEGVMAKAADAPYEAGNRGSAWLKINALTRSISWCSRRSGVMAAGRVGCPICISAFVTRMTVSS